MSLPLKQYKVGSKESILKEIEKKHTKYYPDLFYKTVDDIYNMLPIDGHTRLFVDISGKYYPDRDKKSIGQCFVRSAFDFTESYIYITTM